MKIKITVVKMGGGFRKAIFGQSMDLETGEQRPDAVYGADDEELVARLKIRIPTLKEQLRRKQWVL